MNLVGLLTWVVSEGGAAAVAFWLCDRLPYVKDLEHDYKRYAVFVVTAIVAIGAWAVLTAGQGNPWPVGWWAWLSQLVAIATIAFTGNQFIHAATDLAAKRKA